MQAQDINLNEVVNNMFAMLGRLLGAHIVVQPVPKPNLPAVFGDVGMMEQVLLNLAVNARDAMPRGGQLTIRTETRTIDETQARRNPEARSGDFVCLSVSDTGCGIAPEILPRIFEPFFTTKEVGKGTGLGLATVYGIVKQHQGWIEVVSQLGQGTTFNVFLPASSGTARQAQELISSASARGRGETILVAEDELALRLLAARILRNLGYEVLEAASGTEAIQVWEQHGRKVDLLLTDLVMPDGMTGRELAKSMETRESALKVIYTSGYAPETGETAFVFRGGINFLQKPYQAQTLAKVIRDCLDTKTGKRASLQTSNEDEARQIIEAKNQANVSPCSTCKSQKAYLAGTDSGISQPTWQQALEALTATKRGANKLRWQSAANDKPRSWYRVWRNTNRRLCT